MIARKVYENPEVYLIEVPFQNVALSETNVYVVCDGDDVLIVDMGSPTDEAAAVFVAALDELGIDPSKARYAFTHMHFDHSGLARAYIPSTATIYIHEHERASARPDFTEKMNRIVKRRLEEEGMDSAQASLMCASIEIATPLDDGSKTIETVRGGDVIEVGRHGFEVVDLPGHTRGMMGLYQLPGSFSMARTACLLMSAASSGCFPFLSLCCFTRTVRSVLISASVGCRFCSTRIGVWM